MPAFGVYPVADALLDGEEISSTYEGRHLTFLESELTHEPGLAFVTKGHPVVCGSLVGIPFKTCTAATDLVAIDTEGIWIVDVFAQDAAGVSAVAGGNRLYINTTTCVVSKINSAATQIPFGIALGIVGQGLTERIAVKLHQDPNTLGQIASLVSQELDHAAFTDQAGTAIGNIDFTTGQLPARALVLGTSVNITEAFLGDTTGIIQVGVAADLDRFSLPTDQSVYAISRVAMNPATDGQDGFNAAQTVKVTITGTADWGNVTAGKCFVTIYYIPLA
uniref:Uncharacterized protein n=1 Tax=viral metagenome TaxID=1070528 RepID=A0A6M3IYG7_9ZZZZ